MKKNSQGKKMPVTQSAPQYQKSWKTDENAVTLVPHCFSAVLLALNALRYQEIPFYLEINKSFQVIHKFLVHRLKTAMRWMVGWCTDLSVLY